MFYYMRYKVNNSKLQLSFKKRKKFNNINYLSSINNSNSILVSKHILFYYIYYKLIRKYLKILFGKSYMLKKYIKVWVNLLTNFPISNKSKNSRMGKGKGSLVTWSCRLLTGFKLFTFLGVSKTNLFLILYYLNKILPNKFVLQATNKLNRVYY